jgi:hypothetical protein
MDKHEVEKLVRKLHRTTAELGDGATEAEWHALYQQVWKALSLACDLEEEDVHRKWDEATEALSAELARLDLTVLEATTLEVEGSLDDGNYVIMLRHDDVVSLRKTLAGLDPKGHGLRVRTPEYLLSNGRVAVVWEDGCLHIWSSMEEYESASHPLLHTQPDEVVEPMDWDGILCEPMIEAHREHVDAMKANGPCCESPALPIVKGICSCCHTN